jgi:hypothetical protein
VNIPRPLAADQREIEPDEMHYSTAYGKEQARHVAPPFDALMVDTSPCIPFTHRPSPTAVEHAV